MARIHGLTDFTFVRRFQQNRDGRVLQEEYIVFQEVGGLVVMEAESVPIADPWKLEKSLPGYSGNGYIRFDGNAVTGGPPDGFLSFRFSIQSEGEYFMTFRSNKNYTDDGTWSNDCYTKLASTTSGTTLYDSTKTYAGGQPNQWSWKLNFDLENGEKPVPSFDLVEGEYELVIAGRRYVTHECESTGLRISTPAIF